MVPPLDTPAPTVQHSKALAQVEPRSRLLAPLPPLTAPAAMMVHVGGAAAATEPAEQPNRVATMTTATQAGAALRIIALPPTRADGPCRRGPSGRFRP